MGRKKEEIYLPLQPLMPKFWKLEKNLALEDLLLGKHSGIQEKFSTFPSPQIRSCVSLMLVLC